LLRAARAGAVRFRAVVWIPLSPEDAAMQWQYKTMKLTPAISGVLKGKVDAAALDAMLNQHGQDRWELVTILTVPGDMGGEVVGIMKRPAEPVGPVSELRGACPTCGYDLRGADHDACPECGWNGGEG
jgi:hypothetical protein